MCVIFMGTSVSVAEFGERAATSGYGRAGVCAGRTDQRSTDHGS